MKPFAFFLALLVSLLATTQGFAAWAIAMGTSGVPIVSYGYYSVAEAKQPALHMCTQRGVADCKIVATGYTACLAVADNGNPAHPRWGVGKAGTKADADQQAIADCAGKSGSCVISIDHCG